MKLEKIREAESKQRTGKAQPQNIKKTEFPSKFPTSTFYLNRESERFFGDHCAPPPVNILPSSTPPSTYPLRLK
jgi:hypothetical protein